MVTETLTPAASRHRVGGAAWPLVFLFFALMGAVGLAVSLALTGVFPYWLASLSVAVLLYLIAHINHEAVHRNISGSRSELNWLNDLIGHLGSFWLFLPFPAFRAVHLAHHRMTNHPELDGDMWFARSTPLGVFLSCCSLLYGYEIRLQRLRNAGLVRRNVIRHSYAQRFFALILVITAIMSGFGYEVLMLWLLPGLIAMPVLAFMFAYVVHHPHTSQETYSASNVWLSRGPLQSLLTGVFVFQNYHLVHHLYPRVPFYRYGDVFRRMRPELEARGASIKQLFS